LYYFFSQAHYGSNQAVSGAWLVLKIGAGMMKLEVRCASLRDLIFVDHLQKRNAEELAFYPKQVFEREIENERILLALVNNEPAGYLYHGAQRTSGFTKIHQACIEYDLRGNWYGAALCKLLEESGILLGIAGIQLRCGSDIAANRFWKLMGFKCVDVQPGGVRRMRDINVWMKELASSLFPYDFVDPSDKKKDASFWRRRGSRLSQSIMLRGQSLLDYRRKVLEESGVEDTLTSGDDEN